MRIIVPIQVLRALAATAVVVSHFQFDLSRVMGTEAPHPALVLGNAGVDVFFVISGFVIVYASDPLFAKSGGPLTFFAHRSIRIVPLYWLATAIYLLIAEIVPGFEKGYSLDTILASLFFVPNLREMGVVQPIVGQGWTLNYEMFFYAIFAIAVFFPRGIAVAMTSSLLVCAVLAGLLFAPLPVAFAFWSDPIVLEFVFGMLLAVAYRRGLRLPRSACFVLMIAGAALFAYSANDLPTGSAWRPIAWGAPATLIVAGATLGNFSPAGLFWYALGVIGEASYALYLFHSFPVRAVARLARWSEVVIADWYWILLAAAVLGAIALAIALHYIFERPVTRALRKCISARGPTASPPIRLGTGESSR